MARLILKCPYLKGGTKKNAAHLSNLVKYMATREGVEKQHPAHGEWQATKKQQKFVAQILYDFPDSKELFEYEDYVSDSTRSNASEFISVALEQNLNDLGDREKYLDYIANRPRVEKLDTHGLFSPGSQPLVLAQVAKELAEHPGNVWMPIISLRREDAARYGYDNAAAWQALLMAKSVELAHDLKISPQNFRWYAAYHDEGSHPHIHMVCYSTDLSEGYLTKVGIQKMKSALVNEIFSAELVPIYREKSQQRDVVKQETVTAMRDVLAQMREGTLRDEKIETLLVHLAEQLQRTKGKKQYGYLKVDLKNEVDEIVNILAKDERVEKAYHLWWQLKHSINQIYGENNAEMPPLSQCEDFKAIRNSVISETQHLYDAVLPEEESTRDSLVVIEQMDAAPLPMPELPPEKGTPTAEGRNETLHPSKSWWSEEYKQAKQYLYGNAEKGVTQDFEKAREMLLAVAKTGNPLACFDLGRMAADGLGVAPDADAAQEWYAKAFAGFHKAEAKKPSEYTEYRIGKMLAAGQGVERDDSQAAQWLGRSASKDYKYAEYSLGGLYARGDGVEQSYERAYSLYRQAAEQDFPYASFELGKMLRDGIGCTKDETKSQQFFAEAFRGFQALEHQSKDDRLQYRLGWMLLNGIGTEKNIPLAKEYLERAATVGNTFACYQLAKLILADDKSDPVETKKAVAFLQQAANSENSYAQYFLGKLCLEGKVTEQSATEAVRLFRLAAMQGNEYAAYQLGKLYLGGEGVTKDIDEAIRWLEQAAEKKNQYAEYALGTLYIKGEELPKDTEKALLFLHRAAAQNNEYAQYRLGKLYLAGEDIPKDVQTALRFLKDAAAQGNQYAQYTLGKLYLMGKDVEQDKEEAVHWFTLSAAQGNEYAKFFLEHINDMRESSAFLAATRLLRQMERLFQNSAPLRTPQGMHIDRKRRLKLNEKKRAAGHKQDDHEITMTY